jgi:hypothetical protein
MLLVACAATKHQVEPAFGAALGPGLVDGPTLFLWFRLAAVAGIALWVPVLVSGYLRCTVWVTRLLRCRGAESFVTASCLAAAALVLVYVTTQVWTRNNPYTPLSGPSGFGWPVDPLLDFGLVPVLWAPLLLLGRPRAYLLFALAGAVLAVPLNDGSFIWSALGGLPMLAVSVALRRSGGPDFPRLA